MDIQSLGQAYAGQWFHFEVSGGTRPTRMEARIDRNQVLFKDCDDPPCHEMIFIPLDARGATVRVIARDMDGNVEEKTFRVVDADTSAGGMMAEA